MRFLSGSQWSGLKRWRKKILENLILDKNLSSLATANQWLKPYFMSFLGVVLSILGPSVEISTWRQQKNCFSRRFIHVCAYHFLHMGRRKIIETLNFNVQRLLGMLICYSDFEEARPFVKDIYIVLTTERRSDLVEYHIHLQAI